MIHSWASGMGILTLPGKPPTAMKLPATMNWPTLRRKLLAGLIAVGLAYAIGYYWPSVDPTDPVSAFCAKVAPGMPIAQVQAEILES